MVRPSLSHKRSKKIKSDDEHLVDLDSEIRDLMLSIMNFLHASRVLLFNDAESSQDHFNVVSSRLVQVAVP